MSDMAALKKQKICLHTNLTSTTGSDGDPGLCDLASLILGRKLFHRNTAERHWQNSHVLRLCGSLYLCEKSEGVRGEIKKKGKQ